jgi:hypothetical protein
MNLHANLENRIAKSLFTAAGLVRLDEVAIRHFDTPLLADEGWRFDKGAGNGWSEAFIGKAHARAELSVYLEKEEDNLVRALTGIADFAHSPRMSVDRVHAPRAGNDGLVFGYYRMRGEHVHIIRQYDGFICSAAVRRSRIECIDLRTMPEALQNDDRCMILDVESVWMARVIILNPKDPITILPATVEEDGLFGVTAKSIREAIEIFDGMDHDTSN